MLVGAGQAPSLAVADSPTFTSSWVFCLSELKATDGVTTGTGFDAMKLAALELLPPVGSLVAELIDAVLLTTVPLDTLQFTWATNVIVAVAFTARAVTSILWLFRRPRKR